MSTVFINYRREETAGEARALFNDFVAMLGKGSAFMDVDDISLGRDFRLVLQEHLASCDLMIVLIGKDWLHIKNEAGQVRLDNPNDFVRLEIATALKRNILVTPVLVHGARMPSAEQLPDDLKDLSYRNGFELSHSRWASDFQEMIKRLGLRPDLASPPGVTSAPTGFPTHRRFLAVAGALLVATAIAAWMVIRNDAEKLGPVQAEASHQSASQPGPVGIIGGTPAFFACSSRAQCTSGTACVDNGGDKSYWCKPYCSEDAECANVRKIYSGARCLPLKDSKNLQICNEHESSLIPQL